MTVVDTTTPRTEDVAAFVQRWLAESETHPSNPQPSGSPRCSKTPTASTSPWASSMA